LYIFATASLKAKSHSLDLRTNIITTKSSLTLNASSGRILQRIFGDGDGGGPRRSIGNFSDLRGALPKIRPFVARSIAEAIGDGTIGTVYYTCASRVLNSGNCFLILAGGKHRWIVRTAFRNTPDRLSRAEYLWADGLWSCERSTRGEIGYRAARLRR
jgi:hypothetical protein